jgi:hypothetical protein
MTSSKFFIVVAAVVAVMLAASAVAADGGPCKGGFWPDSGGCCPQIIKGSPYYRDSNNKCYPKQIAYGIYYADSNGFAHTQATLALTTRTTRTQRG